MMKRIDKPTPNGGDYAIMFFYNNDGKSVSEKEATVIHVHEYTKDDKFIKETILTKTNTNKEK